MFAGLGLPIVAMLVLILATWTTNTGNAYMSGLAACKMFSIKDSKRPLVTMICGMLGVLMAIAGLADFLNTYISILGAPVTPIWVMCSPAIRSRPTACATASTAPPSASCLTRKWRPRGTDTF